MRLRENPIFGRKVFFINPSFVIEKKVSEALKEQEYEVYLIKSYTDAKYILRNFENAMCFINIDNDLSLKAWFNFIRSFEDDPQLKSIFVGIMAVKTPEASVKKFIMNLKLPGGYIPLDLDSEELIKRITGILELNGAKGNRKYLSLTCNNVEALTGYIAYGSKLYAMRFENISSIGITCSLPNDLSQILKKNTILNNVSLSLGRWSVITQCVVLSVNTLNNEIIAVLLFTRETPSEVKTSIRKFIYEVLNRHLYELTKNAPPDNQNYLISSGGEGIPDYDAPTEEDKPAEQAPEVESLEELDDSEKAEDKPADEEQNKEEGKEKIEEKSESTDQAEEKKTAEPEDSAKQ